MNGVTCVILGGGRGTRLFPLTKERAKPAVPLAGKYRLIDIPVSNCLNSGLNRIHVLTQFNTASLHRHIAHTYKFDDFGGGYVEILAAEQTTESMEWYQGTADAVRQNVHHLRLVENGLCLILSGDQLYQMDFRRMVRYHQEREALLTIAAIPVTRQQAQSLGVLKIGQDCAIRQFHEKPGTEAALDEFAMDRDAVAAAGVEVSGERTHLASMGIYLFDAAAMTQALGQSDAEDFGKQIIPQIIQTSPSGVYAFPFDGYWEDIGTISAFFNANLDLTAPVPSFNLFEETAPVWTHPRYLPSAKLNDCSAANTIVSEGSTIDASSLKRCVVGLRSVIRAGCCLENVVMMGADYFEEPGKRQPGLPGIGLGHNVRVRNAIIDKNARIGDGVVIENREDIAHLDGPGYFIRDGIVVVPSSGVIEPGTII